MLRAVVQSVFLSSVTDAERLKDEQVYGGAMDRYFYASDAHSLCACVLFSTTTVIKPNRRKLNKY